MNYILKETRRHSMQWKCNTNWHEWLELHHHIFHVPFPLSHPLLHLSLFFLCTFPRKAPSLNLFVSKSHKRSFLQWKQKWHWFNYRKWYNFCSEKKHNIWVLMGKTNCQRSPFVVIPSSVLKWHQFCFWSENIDGPILFS